MALTRPKQTSTASGTRIQAPSRPPRGPSALRVPLAHLDFADSWPIRVCPSLVSLDLSSLNAGFTLFEYARTFSNTRRFGELLEDSIRRSVVSDGGQALAGEAVWRPHR